MASIYCSVVGRTTSTANGAELLYWPTSYLEKIRTYKSLFPIQQARGVIAIRGIGEIFAEVRK